MDTVETATAQGTFSVLSFVQETAYPEGEVKIYTDVAGAKELLRANAERQLLETKDMEKAEELTPRIEELTKRIEATALTFHLKGFPPGVVQDMMTAHNTPEDENAADAHLIAKAIVKVTNPDGAVDDHYWTAEEVNQLRANIAEGQWSALLSAVGDVLFNAAVFNTAVDAGFLGRRPDVAE